ncbi:signal recognition particle receptor subunit alpha homolog [Trichomonascus vanleenenianus]|uniref:signal recognition particle receptor subunit alpha n=1 Tax=Trichomonascus vanleenenianus TaxID=2268995 RepID=UPI003ECAA358
MLDLLSVFTTGGIVLWSQRGSDSKGDAVDTFVNSLVSEVFVDAARHSTVAASTFQKGGYTAKYVALNDIGVVVVGVYQTVLQLRYVGELVESVRKIFTSVYGETVKECINEHVPLTKERLADEEKRFAGLVAVSEQKFAAEYDRSAPNQPVAEEEQPKKVEEPMKEERVERAESPAIDSPVVNDSTPITAEDIAARVKKARRGGKKKSQQNSGTASPATTKKKMRTWGEDGYADEVDGNTVLDYSGQNNGQSTGGGAAAFDESAVGDLSSWGSANKQGEFVLKELSDELENILGDEDETNTSASSGSGGFGFLRNFIGGKTMTREDLDKALASMKTHLMQKNVASEVADHLCSIVDKSLVGVKTQSWTSVEKTVRQAMTDALRRILTPKTSLDLLHEVQTNAKKNARPYVISVVGVNGVGKSTNLSKIGFWLLQNKFKVLVAACDTFRSGAVEQLKVHVNRLQELTSRIGAGEVDIFDQGYGKDAAVTAQKAIEYAQREGYDVVLIDTAGRRHNDDRLMSSLEKFGKLAQPDKIIMVGEALVGTDSVAQARNFNAAFGPSRNLDFFLISKCDTVGDMIGSMVNMTYSTGIPVLFVGIGQNYTDLRTLSVDWAVSLLMS